MCTSVKECVTAAKILWEYLRGISSQPPPCLLLRTRGVILHDCVVAKRQTAFPLDTRVMVRSLFTEFLGSAAGAQ